MIINQKGVKRITLEVCRARVNKNRCPAHFKDPKRCPIYKEEVKNEQ